MANFFFLTLLNLSILVPKWYNLRQKAAHPSINTKKDEGVPAEFLSTERKGGDSRINIELVNSQTSHNNRMADDQLQQLLHAFLYK